MILNTVQRLSGLLMFILLVSDVIYAQQPYFQSGNDPKPANKKWEIIDKMSDDFDGTTLDNSKWAINTPTWIGRPPGIFKTNAVKVEDGNLKFTAYKLQTAENVGGNRYTHAGALVRSLQSHKFGYYECKMKGNKTFMSSTFWLINTRNEGTGCDVRVTELDITETVGVNSGGASWINATISNMNSNTHSRNTACNNTPVGSKGDKVGLGGKSWEDYHVYGAWWKSKDEILFYLDGKFVYKIKPPADFDLPMYLRMVTETYDWNPPKAGKDGMNDTKENRTTYYDWVRTYKLVDDNTSDTVAAIPGTFQAEHFNLKSGSVKIEDTPGSGGKNLGFIRNNDFTEYKVNVSSAGKYVFDFFASSKGLGGTIDIMVANTVVGSLAIPVNGNWHDYKKHSVSLNLSAGQQTLRFVYKGGTGYLFNIDRIATTLTAPIAQTVVLSPIHDAFLQGSTRYDGTIIRVEQNNRIAYMMFDLSSINGTVTDAKLKFTVTEDAGNGNVSVNKGTSNAWTEDNLSNTNKPSLGAVLGNLNSDYELNTTKTVNLDASAISGNRISLVMNMTNGNDFAFASKEHASLDAPQLIVTYTPSASANLASAVLETNKEEEKPVLSIHPNPVKNRINVANFTENSIVKVFDLQGNLKKETILNATQNSIEVTDIPSGYIIIQIFDGTTGDVVLSKTLVKQ